MEQFDGMRDFYTSASDNERIDKTENVCHCVLHTIMNNMYVEKSCEGVCVFFCFFFVYLLSKVN